ncbi:MAG: M28 family peptidase [Terriglobales bacterium]
MKKRLLPLACFLSLVTASHGIPAGAEEQPAKVHSQANSSATRPRVCGRCVRAHEEFLASDALQGRGSGTHDELVAATYVASQLRQYGIAPAGDSGGYLQKVSVVQDAITAPPQLSVGGEGGSQPILWTSGKEFRAAILSQTEFAGPLQKIDAAKSVTVKPGAIILLSGGDAAQVRTAVLRVVLAGAAAVLVSLGPKRPEHAAEGAPLPKSPTHVEGANRPERLAGLNLLQLSSDAIRTLEQMPEGTMVRFTATSQPKQGWTWNAVGILRGVDSSPKNGAVLLSAHLDHLGIGVPVNGDEIYNGADDDASGTTAVLELARVLGRGPRPRRTVIFALFGSEETGGLGSTYFRQHPPVPLKEIAVNLEFEMIGRCDPFVSGDTLWLTGWERSNLGPALVAHGARLVADPHPAEDFFARSDNYLLALDGVVAQTISSYGLHHDYHQPSDDLAHLDFPHMDAAIGSLLRPIEWMVNADFQPKWNPGGQP